MKKLIVALSTSLFLFGTQTWAQISIGPSLTSGNITFDSRPAATEWATRSSPTDDTATTATLDARVNTNIASTITSQVLDSSPNNPPGQNALASWTSGGTAYLQTRPTGNGHTILMAILHNDSGAAASSLTISYNLAQGGTANAEQILGQRVYYSLTGDAGSWTPITDIDGTIGAKSATVTLGTGWASGTAMYVLFVDDNGNGSTDRGYQIDDVNFTIGTATLPLSVTLTAPTTSTVVSPANVTVTASVGGSTPATSVFFYTNNVLFATLTAGPFTTQLAGLPPGTYAIHVEAENGVDPRASSATATVTVRDQYMHYTGGTLTETFDSMGTSDTETPLGWYVSAAPPINSMSVIAGDGSVGVSGSILGWNLGMTADNDRALGTGPTGAERNMAVRIQNNTSSNITEITFFYDGEVWRNYTNNIAGYLTNFVSVDLGTTWIATGFNFISTPFDPQNAVNGNDPANRVAAIGGTIALPTPVGPGEVIMIRWLDPNEGSTDGILAIDNFSFTATLAPYGQFAQISVPTNGATFSAGANITISASASMVNPIVRLDFFHDNNVLIGSDTNVPYSVVYSNVPVGTHTLTVVANDSLGGFVSSTNTVTITVNPNSLPSVSITNPAPNSEYFVGTYVTNISASASDSDGTIARVEFYLDGSFLMSDTTSPYGFDLCDVPLGTHTVAAVAVDNAGGMTTNTLSLTATNPPGVTTIVANGQLWKFLDNGSDQGTAWQATGFSDAGWSNGIAELGYGDGPGRPERTVVGYGPSATAKYPTTYFRKSFNVVDPSAFTNLILRLMRDDHAIVYLNGTQVYSDMTNLVVTYATYEPPTFPDDGTVYVQTNVPVNLLVAGINTLAVEVHQDAGNSSDISFDAMLWGEAGAVATKPPLAFSHSGNNLVITWPDTYTGFQVLETTTLNPINWQNSVHQAVQGNGLFTVTIPTTNKTGFIQLSK